jgi:hypothetical protein
MRQNSWRATVRFRQRRISTPPGEWHWHGAAPDHYMIHLSITEAPGDERPEADWGEHVTDDEYHNR